jgi:retinol dehydrogenase 12
LEDFGGSLNLCLPDVSAFFYSKEQELHVPFNSGGVMFPPVEQITADGYDLQFGTNVLGLFLALAFTPRTYYSNLFFLTGHFYFTKLLIPTLISTAVAFNGPLSWK